MITPAAVKRISPARATPRTVGSRVTKVVKRLSPHIRSVSVVMVVNQSEVRFRIGRSTGIQIEWYW